MDSITAAIYKELLMAYLSGPKSERDYLSVAIKDLTEEAGKIAQSLGQIKSTIEA